MKIKKILAGVVGIGLIVLLLLFVNSLVGNPVSKILAKNSVQKYIDENYSQLSLKIDSCNYNFKFGNYVVFCKSLTSQDTAFSVYTNGFGKIRNDDYESEVANNFTTYRRLEDELRKTGKEIIGNKLKYDFEFATLRFNEKIDTNSLKRDMELNVFNPPQPIIVDVVVFSDDLSYNKIAQVAKDLEKLLKEENIPVAEYSVRLLPLENKPENSNQSARWLNSISVSNFPQSLMDKDNLPNVIEEFEIKRNNSLDKK